MTLLSLKKIIFYLIVFLIPCNLGKHWIQNWSYVNGILVDYLIPTLYLTDILIITILFLWFWQYLIKNFQFSIFNFQSIFKHNNFKIFKYARFDSESRRVFFIFGFWFLILFFSHPLNFPGFLYKLVKIIEFSLLIYWIKLYINIKQDIKNIALVLSLSVIWQSVLALGQWLKQGSVFGYWFFGEQPYNLSTHGIKQISWFGVLKIPSYGTFTHPNVLAGFLVISLIIIVCYLDHGRGLKCNILSFGSILLGSITLFFTFSFVSWIAYITGLAFIIMSYHRRMNSAIALIFLITIYFLLFSVNLKFIDPSSFQRRQELNKIAFGMWLSSPLVGVGLNNFIPRMEEFGTVTANYRFLQPVHNIYLLVLAETGIIGEIGLIWLIWLIGKKQRVDTRSTPTFLLLIPALRRESRAGLCLAGTAYCLLFLGLFDHYFLTIQQGMLMLSLVLGLSLSQYQGRTLFS